MKIENIEQVIDKLYEMDKDLSYIWTYIIYGEATGSSMTKRLQLFQLAGEVRAVSNMIKRIKVLSLRVTKNEIKG